MIPFAVMQGEATVFTLISQGIIKPKWNSDFQSVSGVGPEVFYYLLIPLVMLAGSFLML
jgi:preprotein translocase subunit SecY